MVRKMLIDRTNQATELIDNLCCLLLAGAPGVLLGLCLTVNSCAGEQPNCCHGKDVQPWHSH